VGECAKFTYHENPTWRRPPYWISKNVNICGVDYRHRGFQRTCSRKRQRRLQFSVFIAQRDIDIAILSVCPSVCACVCVSRSDTVSKRLKISTYFLQHMVAQSFYMLFSQYSTSLRNSDRPRRWIQMGYINSAIFCQIGAAATQPEVSQMLNNYSLPVYLCLRRSPLCRQWCQKCFLSVKNYPPRNLCFQQWPPPPVFHILPPDLLWPPPLLKIYSCYYVCAAYARSVSDS